MKTPLCGRRRRSEMGGRQKTAVLKTPPPRPVHQRQGKPYACTCRCFTVISPYSQFMNVAWGSSCEETHPSYQTGMWRS